MDFLAEATTVSGTGLSVEQIGTIGFLCLGIVALWKAFGTFISKWEIRDTAERTANANREEAMAKDLNALNAEIRGTLTTIIKENGQAMTQASHKIEELGNTTKTMVLSVNGLEKAIAERVKQHREVLDAVSVRGSGE